MAQIGLIGLAVMGKNIVLNLADHGYEVVIYNRTLSKVDDLLNEKTSDQNIIGTHSLEEFFSTLDKPRIIMLMVKAGVVVDQWIEKLTPYLEEGDILIDGGNSYYQDTIRRADLLEKKKIHFIGMGISGGEEGARFGPSIMVGGDLKVWAHLQKIFQDIAAKVDDFSCCEWVGKNASGHFVKMVHNGIEYVDMQLIAESYDLLKNGTKCTNEELTIIFKNWNESDLQSYLIEITAKILEKKENDQSFVVDNILDVASQKGTGAWSAIQTLELGLPYPAITEAVMARFLSSQKEQRINASKILQGPKVLPEIDKADFIQKIKEALLSAKVIAYMQGFLQIAEASNKYDWKIAPKTLAKIWQGGCIIRSSLLKKMQKGFEEDGSNILLIPYFTDLLNRYQEAFRKVVATGVLLGIALPCFSSTLAFYDGYRKEKLPANLIQAQRDFFGAHTFERIDQERGKFFHANWE